ncbi:TPA: DUF3709 domain-containing protein, partial [Vibrio cholerae]
MHAAWHFWYAVSFGGESVLRNVAGSSRFEQFGAFTYRLKVSRQLSIVLRCLMKRQCVCRCKFQCD